MQHVKMRDITVHDRITLEVSNGRHLSLLANLQIIK